MVTTREFMARKLRELRNAKNLSAKEVGAAVDRSKKTVYAWESGRGQPDADTLIKLCDLFGVEISEFYDDAPQPFVSVQPSPSRMIPFVGRVAAGEAKEAIEVCDRFYPWPEELLNSNDKYAWIQASGNSMNRDFADKTMVLLNLSKEVRNGDIAAVFVNGDDVTIKQVFFEDDAIRLHPRSYDPEYMDRVIDKNTPGAPEVRFFGRAEAYAAPIGWRP